MASKTSDSALAVAENDDPYNFNANTKSDEEEEDYDQTVHSPIIMDRNHDVIGNYHSQDISPTRNHITGIHSASNFDPNSLKSF